MNALDYLETDHEKVLDLISQVENLSNKGSAVQKELFTEIRLELKLHEIVEEKILYPGLKKDEKDLILEAIEEHKVVDKLLEELAETSMQSDTWKAKMTVLRENLEHHIKEEREEIFPLAREHFSTQALEAMVAKMEQMKAKEQAAIA
jgi:iron-sulfur cluster repair protein YtfE (RIC family)